ncbi:MAG: ABC transporter ATP-binding protein [Xanthomonadales bacterium]|nr:ABC transporter ATP-binding protein [Xanthomonadales bacterium]
MSGDEFAIRVKNLSKCYKIFNQPHDRLKHSIYPRMQRLTGLPVKQYFREFWALKDVSFEVRKGETIGIIGRNGSGKSTLLQMICGTLAPTNGELETNGRIAALLELGSGFNPEFTGRENVFMNGAILGLSQGEIESRFDDIAAFADIGQFIDQPVKTFSSGMMVRLAFAVAINVNPQILIVDEALSVGDELFQRKCFARIESIKQNGSTILFVSHSGREVVQLCDYAMLLDSGEKLAIGVPKIIVGKYQKLIYAPQDKYKTIREDIRSSLSGEQQGIPLPSPRQETRQSIERGQGTDEHVPEELFDSDLKPQSTLEYASNGAFIASPEILTLSGDKVNCLKRGESYRYMYKVRFDQDVTNVRFGMLIKTISGLELGGSVSAPSGGQGIPYQAAGTSVSVEFRFTCNLNSGLYFLNAGVTGTYREEETYLHRVLDICMFRVWPISADTATAIVDFSCVAEIELLDKTMHGVAAE